jgi:hypothetical protein
LLDERFSVSFEDVLELLQIECLFKESEGALQALNVGAGEWVAEDLQDESELVISEGELAVGLEQLFDQDLWAVNHAALQLSILALLWFLANYLRDRSVNKFTLLNKQRLDQDECLGRAGPLSNLLESFVDLVATEGVDLVDRVFNQSGGQRMGLGLRERDFVVIKASGDQINVVGHIGETGRFIKERGLGHNAATSRDPAGHLLLAVEDLHELAELM